MSKAIIDESTLTSLADKIRVLNGTEDTMTPAQMDSELGDANDEVDIQSGLIDQLSELLDGKASGGNAEPVLQDKTVTPTTSKQTVTADDEYDGLNSVTVNAMPTATQATPSITVSSGGLITASATQSAGYVSSGTKNTTKQLTVQAAQTITPSTSNKTIASGRYLTGTQTIKGDSNLVAENIKSGVSIFGVNGSYDGGSDSSVESCVVTLQSSAQTGIQDICYTDDKLVYHRNLTLDANKSINLNVAKNTMLYCIEMGTGAGEVLTPRDNTIEFANNVIPRLYTIRGDGTLYIARICFAKGTIITLHDGSKKEVQNISYSDELLVWDFDNSCYASAKPLWIKKTEISSYYYRCVFENGIVLNLIGSDGKCHRVFSLDDNRFESATDCVGKTVVTTSGATKLLSCERVDESVEYYNIITNYHMNLFANDILTSCRLNNLYPIENMRFVKEDRDNISIEQYNGIDNNFYCGLRLYERKAEDIDMLNEYINRLYVRMQS